MSNVSKFDYKGVPITFETGLDTVMVNATQMATTHGKQVSDWTRLKSTDEFINALSSVRGIPRSGLYHIVRGGNSGQGTYFHEDVAMEFARWLSSEFAIWCNDRIKELIRHGVTATPAKIDELLADPDAWIKTLQELKKERSMRMIAEQQRQLAEETIKEQAPKVAFTDSVTASEDSILIGELAKVLRQNGVDIGQNRLFSWMRKNGFLCQFGERKNQPTQRAMDMGLFKLKKYTVDSPDGIMTRTTTKVTGKGQVYFVNRFITERAEKV